MQESAGYIVGLQNLFKHVPHRSARAMAIHAIHVHKELALVACLYKLSAVPPVPVVLLDALSASSIASPAARPTVCAVRAVGTSGADGGRAAIIADAVGSARTGVVAGGEAGQGDLGLDPIVGAPHDPGSCPGRGLRRGGPVGVQALRLRVVVDDPLALRIATVPISRPVQVEPTGICVMRFVIQPLPVQRVVPVCNARTVALHPDGLRQQSRQSHNPR